MYGLYPFFTGAGNYVYVKSERINIFSNIAQVYVMAYKKYHLKLLDDQEVDGIFYDVLLRELVLSKPPLSN